MTTPTTPAAAVSLPLVMSEAHDIGAIIEALEQYTRGDDHQRAIDAAVEVLRAAKALQASRRPQAQQGVAAPLELKVCHSQNASQTPQTGLSLTAAPQEWSPAYTRGPARQSAPVAAVPAMVPLTDEQIIAAMREAGWPDVLVRHVTGAREFTNALASRVGLTVGDGGQG